jgi:hypothetical protein
MLRYHPIRFGRQLTPFFAEVADEFERTRKPGDTPGHDNLLFGIVMEDAFQRLIQANAARLPEHVVSHAKWWSELLENVSGDYGDYRTQGENIFHFNSALVDMLRHTDVDEVTYDLLHFPFQAFYLHFARGVKLNADQTVDGVYIHTSGEQDAKELPALFISFTTRHDGYDYLPKRDPIDYAMTDRYFSTVLSFDEGETIGQALANSLNDEIDIEQRDEITTQDWLLVLRELIQLTLNCLFYLSYEKREVEFRYPPSAPERLVRSVGTALRPTERARSESKLGSQGWRKIHFCGAPAGHATTGEPQSEVSPHWRRGHWRNQPYGHHQSLRRLIWIQPVIVRRDKGEPATKHLYQLPTTPSQ